MKLVQLLAKELKEWPEGAGDVVGQARDGRLHLNGSYEENRGFTDEQYTLAKDWMSADVTKSQWKAEREKMNKPKWIRYSGGNTTLHPGTMIEARLRSGEIQRAIAGEFLWDNSLSDHEVNIMAYRIIEETKDQEIEEVKVADVKLEMMQGDSWVTIGRVSPDFGSSVFDGGPLPKVEEVKDTNPGTLAYKIEVDTSSAMIALNELSAKWDQLESPFKWRDEIIELEAYEEEFRREREKLIRKLESEGFKLIDHMTPVYGEQIIDMSDWRNWQVGDVFVTDGRSEYYTKGKEYVVKSLVDDEAPIKAIDDYGDVFCLCMNEVKFIRRP